MNFRTIEKFIKITTVNCYTHSFERRLWARDGQKSERAHSLILPQTGRVKNNWKIKVKMKLSVISLVLLFALSAQAEGKCSFFKLIWKSAIETFPCHNFVFGRFFFLVGYQKLCKPIKSMKLLGPGSRYFTTWVFIDLQSRDLMIKINRIFF